MLTDGARKIEVALYFCWKAWHYADQYNCENHVRGAMTKIFVGDMAMQCVYDCMRVVGVNSYDRRSHPFDKYMRDVICFPIYDAGNMGMQRRKIWGRLRIHNTIRAPSPRTRSSASPRKWKGSGRSRHRPRSRRSHPRLPEACVRSGRPDQDRPGRRKVLVGIRNHHRSEEHTSELQSLMRISYAVFCLKKKTT